MAKGGKSSDAKFMRLAIASALKGISRGQAPFGACIAKNGKALVSTHNSVFSDCDITSHAEVRAIRIACKKLGAIDLSGCEIYSTAEPCPMCFSAIHWAGIRRIVFGASIKDAKACGFHELEISNEKMKKAGKSKIILAKGVLAAQCKDLFAKFSRNFSGKRLY